jgi:hypothetical protein
MQTRIGPRSERKEYDQHSKEDARGCVINLKVKLGVQVVKLKKPRRRIMKKQTKGKVVAAPDRIVCTGNTVHWTRHRPIFSAQHTFVFWA